MKNNQKGFSAVEILVVVVIIGLLGVIGWLVYDRQNSKSNNQQPVQTTTNQPEQTPTQPPKNEGYYEIKEWGIKIALTAYNKVQFNVKNENGQVFGGDSYEGRADPSFKPEFLQDKSCAPGLTLYRSKVKFASASAQKQVGDYYYVATGGPGACSNNADNQLKNQFLQELSDPKNITAL